jgi:transformation/transcription domain-associated protein
MKLAKAFPQALHFQLRTAKEDYLLMRKQVPPGSQLNQDDSQQGKSGEIKTDADKKGESVPESDASGQSNIQDSRRQPWEYVEEVMALLKTAFPLLALTMETFVDQILQRLKPTTDEDIYRLIVALLNDGVQVMSFESHLISKLKYRLTLYRSTCNNFLETQATMVNFQLRLRLIYYGSLRV